MKKHYLISLVTLCTAIFSGSSIASDYPSKPITMVVGYGAGGGADAIARLYAEELGKALSTSVIVENKPGAYEQIAGRAVASAKPDGYTIYLNTTGGLVLAPLLQKLPFSPKDDFTNIGLVAEAEAVLAVKNGFPVTTFDELISYARNNPDKVNYGSAGAGSASHLVTEHIKMLTNTKMTHIPYKSASDVSTSLASGNIDLALVVPAAAVPLVKADKFKAIAVTGSERLQVLPNVPALSETSHKELQKMGVYAFYAMVGPKGLPNDVTQKLNHAIKQASESSNIQKRSQDLYFKPTFSTPDALTTRIANDTATWSTVTQHIQ